MIKRVFGGIKNLFGIGESPRTSQPKFPLESPFEDESPNLDEWRFTRVSLGIPPIMLPNELEHVASSSEEINYTVSPIEQTCSCPDFLKDRSEQPKFNISRFCKHLCHIMSKNYRYVALPEWQRYILNSGYGGPIDAFSLQLQSAPNPILCAKLNSEWIDVLAKTKRSGETIDKASGPINEFGWNIYEKRWSYGEAPPGSREMRKYLSLIDSIELVERSN